MDYRLAIKDIYALYGTHPTEKCDNCRYLMTSKRQLKCALVGKNFKTKWGGRVPACMVWAPGGPTEIRSLSQLEDVRFEARERAKNV
jgi:hypothetical protein